MAEEQITLAELAERSGVPPRTIRFYISRGLMDGPAKAGRAAGYSQQHLARLERIKTLQSEGRMLSEIAPMLGSKERQRIPPPTAWWQHAIGDDVVVLARADVSPWRMKQVRAAIEEMAHRLRNTEE